MERITSRVLAVFAVVAVASLFTVCSASGANGTGVFSPAVDQTIDVGYGQFRALQPTEQKLLNIVMPVDAEDPDKPAELGEIALSDGEYILGIKIGEFATENYTVKVYDPNSDGDNNPDTPEEETPQWPLSATRRAVTFELDGGSFSGDNPKIVNVGESVTRPAPDPEKANYTFEGWYSEETLGTLYNFASPVNTNISVWAKWAAISDTWLGDNWNTAYTGWDNGAAVSDNYDPTSPATVYTAPGNWVSLNDATFGAGVVTVTVSNGNFTMSGATSDNSNYALATDGLKLENISTPLGTASPRRIVVTGSGDTPLRIMLIDVKIDAGDEAAENPLVDLQDGANVIIALQGENTLKTWHYIGLNAPSGCSVVITSTTSGTLNLRAADNAIGGGGDIRIEGSARLTADGILGGIVGNDITITGSAQVLVPNNDFTGISGGGTISIGGNAQVQSTGGTIGTIGGAVISGTDISIGGAARVEATASVLDAGIGGATIIIGGNARVQSTGGGPGAGISGTSISIGGAARVEAAGGTHGAGIGGNAGGSGGVITINGNALVRATSGDYGAGIGGGIGGLSGTITISGGAKVYAEGGGAGIGGGAIDDGESSSDANVTIGTGSDYPVVIAKGKASGIGAGSSLTSLVQIEIKSGFVVAEASLADGRGIGTNSFANTSYVKISGGSVYALNTAYVSNRFNPAPTNGATVVYPLYFSGTLGNKAVGGLSGYPAASIGKDAARFLVTGLWTASGPDQFPTSEVTGLDGLFPTAISATLWLPEAAYTGITVDGAGNYSANVTAQIAPYNESVDNRLKE
jgi:uncharacterized repeat protein (TIGR02543 family)